jgi:hypothetical protein
VQQEGEENIQMRFQKQENLAKTLYRFIGHDMTKYFKFNDYPLFRTDNLKRLAFYLITKIQEKTWQSLFEACTPVLKQSPDFLYMLLPYLIYFALRFNNTDSSLPEELGQIINSILDSDFSSHIVPILKV